MVNEIDKQIIVVNSGQVYEKPYSFKINPTNSIKYAENRIVLKVKVAGGIKEKVKELRFFYDIKKPDNSINRVVLSLHTCEFPISESRRVNFGDFIKNISYRIDNQYNDDLQYRLTVSVHHNIDNKNCPKICDVATIVGKINPYEDDIVSIPDIFFDEKIYSEYLTSGRLQLRARLSAEADNSIFEKGEKITKYIYDVFLNTDEKNGKRNSFDPKGVNKPDDYRRAWYDVIGSRTIYINFGHQAYIKLADNDEMQHDYMLEQMLRQYVMLYLAEGQFSMFRSGDQEFLELDPVKAAEKVIDKVEEIYNTSIKK